jgi:hypothetical protein
MDSSYVAFVCPSFDRQSVYSLRTTHLIHGVIRAHKNAALQSSYKQVLVVADNLSDLIAEARIPVGRLAMVSFSMSRGI